MRVLGRWSPPRAARNARPSGLWKVQARGNSRRSRGASGPGAARGRNPRGVPEAGSQHVRRGWGRRGPRLLPERRRVCGPSAHRPPPMCRLGCRVDSTSSCSLEVGVACYQGQRARPGRAQFDRHPFGGAGGHEWVCGFLSYQSQYAIWILTLGAEVASVKSRIWALTGSKRWRKL